MPSHLSAIGFPVQSQEDYETLVRALAEEAQPISTMQGRYLLWKGGVGEELWLQVDRSNDFVGMNPHFAGQSSVLVRVESRIRRPGDSVLDGAFQGWADPEPDAQGAYPFVFDAPDFAMHASLDPPQVVRVQLAAFAHEVEFHESPEVFGASQADLPVKFASQSFAPVGLFDLDGTKPDPPQAYAMFAGHVTEAGARRNSRTGETFYWALVDTFGGVFDVVIDPALLPAAPSPGGVLQGQFWLSGRIQAGLTAPSRPGGRRP